MKNLKEAMEEISELSKLEPVNNSAEQKRKVLQQEIVKKFSGYKELSEQSNAIFKSAEIAEQLTNLLGAYEEGLLVSVNPLVSLLHSSGLYSSEKSDKENKESWDELINNFMGTDESKLKKFKEQSDILWKTIVETSKSGIGIDTTNVAEQVANIVNFYTSGSPISSQQAYVILRNSQLLLAGFTKEENKKRWEVVSSSFVGSNEEKVKLFKQAADNVWSSIQPHLEVSEKLATLNANAVIESFKQRSNKFRKKTNGKK